MSKVFSIVTKVLLFAFLGIVIFAILFSWLGPVRESKIEDNSSEYSISYYYAEATYKKDGTLRMHEEISVDYHVAKHGIFRALPTVSHMVLKNDDGSVRADRKFRLDYKVLQSSAMWQGESSGDFYYVRLGNPNYTIPAGSSRDYVLEYDVFIDERYALYDVFYFNMLGNFTDTTIDEFKGVVNFVEDVANYENADTRVYFGDVGSTHQIDAVWTDEHRLEFSQKNLAVGDGVTVKVELPDTYLTVVPNHMFDWFMLGVILLAGIACMVMYTKYHNKSLITPVVQFKATKDYTPADVGFIIDKAVNVQDVASLIIYWADKGFLKINCQGKKTYLVKTGKEFSGKMYEQQIFHAIFAGCSAGEMVEVKSIGRAIADTLTVSKKAIVMENEHLFNKKAHGVRTVMAVWAAFVFGAALGLVAAQNVQDGLSLLCIVAGVAVGVFLVLMGKYADNKYTLKPRGHRLNQVCYFLFMGALAFLAVSVFDSYSDPFGTVFLALALVIFVSALIYRQNVRSDAGVRELGDILGLKRYIELAEKKQIEMLIKDDPEAFYHILPYAYALGVYDEWCKRFEGIDVGMPQYLEGELPDVFDLFLVSQVISSTTRSIMSSINTANLAATAESVSSTMSGFGGGGGSGGGFSGGGIGGGGTGSW